MNMEGSNLFVLKVRLNYSIILYRCLYLSHHIYSCSNSSFQLSALHMPCMVEDGGSDSDGGNFQAVAPQRESEAYEVQEVSHAFEKHRHVLEDVEGELEMEDVAPSLDVELNSICNVYGGNASQLDKKLPLSFAPHFSQDVPSFSPHPPSYAPPPPPPPPPPPSPPTMHLMSATSDQYRTAADSKAFSDSQVCSTTSAWIFYPIESEAATNHSFYNFFFYFGVGPIFTDSAWQNISFSGSALSCTKK